MANLERAKLLGELGITEEKRVTDPDTGGEKGDKPNQIGWCPAEGMEQLGRVYAAGAQKYSPTNFRKGYKWSLSFNALQRHYWLWMNGESWDQETNCHHLAMVAWHCMTLMFFELTHRGTDDRPVVIEP